MQKFQIIRFSKIEKKKIKNGKKSFKIKNFDHRLQFENENYFLDQHNVQLKGKYFYWFEFLLILEQDAAIQSKYINFTNRILNMELYTLVKQKNYIQSVDSNFQNKVQNKLDSIDELLSKCLSLKEFCNF